MSVVILQLPKDILHSVYGEWLIWKDLTRLDLAFVEKRVREVWLTSLTDLRLSMAFEGLSNGEVRLFYIWLLSRKVFCVEGFPIRLDVFEDLVRALDMESYCPAFRSIEISSWSINIYSSDISELKSNLSLFLSHCHNLQGVTLSMSYSDNDVVLSVLVEMLRENSLVRISLQDINIHYNNEDKGMITDLLTKHASSLRHLHITTMDKVDVDFIVSTLIDNTICLKELTISLAGDPSEVMPSLMPYISSSGGLLEEIYVNPFGNSWIDCYWKRT